ncbi:hypothetical protein ILUMI_17719 [Ignelater luminosus]|uniref:Uncharacterized protein n=1 Tax=Ignelater luminosus TaxID=2038154 RepID=A0A8K0CL80_IGNLU|nr:hypothetical protein ILUMI_17719 [Ignelater luminosus]
MFVFLAFLVATFALQIHSAPTDGVSQQEKDLERAVKMHRQFQAAPKTSRKYSNKNILNDRNPN